MGQTSSTNFPTTAGALQRSNTFGLSAFTTALNPHGSAVDYSTYLGDATIGKGIALDSSGAVYLGGEADVTGTGTGGLPTTPGAFHTSYGGGVGDAFVAKFHPAVVLSVTKRGSGAGTVTSSPGTINCGRSCSQAFTLNDNVNVTLRASSMPGSTFAGWSGACSGSGTCTLAMNADRTITGTFTASPTPARLTQLKLTPATFRAAGHGASISASKKPKKKRPPVGTKVSYRDTRAAATRFTVQLATAGVQQGKKCVRTT